MDQQPPRTIGPYRIDRQIGAGGMGDVFLAFDDRLQRPVAVKRIRTREDVDTRSQQRRLMREAQAVARLSHPAVVQIHDVVIEDGDPWLVMEYVEGRTVAEILREGPLPIARLIAIAIDVTEGLAAAHAKGLLHRDLKTDNVMITHDGRARLLDFGLAKPFWPAAAEDSLTGSGMVVGTHHAMSPEQARGTDLDPRSDLFALGTLLYETATGVAPFRQSDPVATMARVLTHEPAEASALRPMPTALSQLIDELLDKDRERRPRDALDVATRLRALRDPDANTAASSPDWAVQETLESPAAATSIARADPVTPAVPSTPERSARSRWRRRLTWVVSLVAVGIAVGTMAWFGARALSNQRLPRYVAVETPSVRVEPARSDADLLGLAIESAMLRGLLAYRDLKPVTVEHATGAESAVELARAVAADEVLTTRLDCRERRCQVAARRLRGDDGSLLWLDTIDVDPDDPQLMHNAITLLLRRGFADHRLNDENPGLDVQHDDYARFLRLKQAHQVGDGGISLDEMLAELAAIRASSPRFLDAYLLAADLEGSRFYERREPAAQERALDLLDRARALAPQDPRPLDSLFGLLLASERLDEASQIVDAAEAAHPGDAAVAVQRALLVERRGDADEALRLMARAVDRRPARRGLLAWANMAYRQSRIDLARTVLDRLLQRLPDELEGRSFLAQIELLSGSAERAEQLYADLVARAPNAVDLANLGVTRLLLGRYEAAAGSLRQARQEAPDNAGIVLNLADAELLSHRPADADSLYHEVLALTDAESMDELPWTLLTTRAQAYAHIGQAIEAVQVVQRAVHQAPNNPQVAFEASIVYALVGDHASALAFAREAIDGGVGPRWLRFPWFAPLADEPSFQQLLADS